MVLRSVVTLSLLLVSCAVSAAPELAYNIDCWCFGDFFYKPEKSDPEAVRKGAQTAPENYGWYTADVQGAIAYVDDILRGAVTRLVMNVNGQRSNVDSQAFEPIWQNGITNGMPQYKYVRLMKDLHDRGIDYFAVWTRRCREKGVQPWMSIRMNDMHVADDPGCPSISDFWREHPEYRRYPNSVPKGIWFWESQSLDFAHAAVRDRICNYIVEILNKYDIDGLELDWTRFAWVFAPGKERENAPLLTQLMRRIRRAANETAKRRHHPILISCRMLATPETEIAFGRDVGVWGHEKLMDIVDVGNHFETPDFEIPVDRWRQVLGDGVQVVPHVDCSLAFDWRDGRYHTRLLSREEYLGWADVMETRGCRDLSLYNLFGQPRSSPENVLTLTRGLVGDAVAKEPRRYPLSHRDRCFSGARDPAYPPRLSTSLDKGFACSIPVGAASGMTQLILGLGNPATNVPPATVNGVRTGAFTPCEEFGCHGLAAPVPASALRRGHNDITLPAVPGSVLVYVALRVTP